MSESEMEGTSPKKGIFIWGFIVLDKDLNCLIARTDKKGNIIHGKDIHGKKTMLDLIKSERKVNERKNEHIQKIASEAENCFTSGQNGNPFVDGIIIGCYKKADVQIKLCAKLQSLVFYTYKTKNLVSVNPLEYIIQFSKQDRKKHEQISVGDLPLNDNEEEKDRVIQSLKEGNSEKDRMIQQLKDDNTELNNENIEKDKAIQHLKDDNTELNNENIEKDKAIQKLEHENTEKVKVISKIKEDNQKKQLSMHQNHLANQKQLDQHQHQQYQQTQLHEQNQQDQHLKDQQQKQNYQDQQKCQESEVRCKIVSPPPQVSAIHQQIIRGLGQRLTSEGLHLSEGESGPSLVVAVNNSRLGSDVKRDIAKAGLKDGPILLLIIKATRNLDEKPYVQIHDLEDSRIQEVCFFLVDANFSKLHKCQLNNKSFNSVSKFLKSQS